MNSKTYILGISAYWNEGAATLLSDGEVVASFQESKFTGVGNDLSFPTNAIRACLVKNNLSLEEIHFIVFYEKPFLRFEKEMKGILLQAPLSFRQFMDSTAEWISEGKLFLKGKITEELKKINSENNLPELLFGDSLFAATLYPDHGRRYDLGAAMLVWCFHLKNSLPEMTPDASDGSSKIENFAEVKQKQWSYLSPISEDSLTAKELKKFGLVMGAIVFFIFWLALPIWRKTPQNHLYLLLSSVLIIVAGLFSKQLKYPYILWMIFARLVGKLKAVIFYTLSYFIIVCPYALLVRMFFSKILTVPGSSWEKFDMKSPF